MVKEKKKECQHKKSRTELEIHPEMDRVNIMLINKG